jgi:hypothetical protein
MAVVEVVDGLPVDVVVLGVEVVVDEEVLVAEVVAGVPMDVVVEKTIVVGSAGSDGDVD